MHIKIPLFFLFSSLLSANGDVGCNAIIDDAQKGCSIENILNKKEDLKFVIREENIYITKEQLSIKVIHNEHETLIQRVPMKDANSCPPFCIEPLSIEGVQTVAELETLAFIEKLKEKKARLLIDVRSNKAYRKETIPGAISLPSHMIEDKSPYQEEVLKLLGAKKLLSSKEKWYFPDGQFLLIFGQSATNNEASGVVKQLLKLGYPAKKILYYRGGIASWRAMGLSVI